MAYQSQNCRRQPSVFSFFSGSGFLDLGFEAVGFEVCWVNECHRPFLEAYKYARTVMELPLPRYGHDATRIESLSSELLSAHIHSELQRGQLVGFIGGPPCPDFSVAGKNRGKTGENGKLSQIYVDLICAHKPSFFLFENVKGLYRTKKHRQFFERLKRQLRKAGYYLHERLINSIEYGVPQDRERIILIGFLDQAFAAPFCWVGRTYQDRVAFEFDWPSTSPFEMNSVTKQKDDVPTELCVQYWFDRNDVDGHANAGHCFEPRAGLRRFLTVAEGDDSRKSYKRLHRWRYAPTAAYGNNEVHLHPYLARRISVAEALAIQSMPKEFALPPNMTLSDMFKTIGNGVPYLAAKGVAQSISKHLRTNNARHRPEHRKSHRSVAA